MYLCADEADAEDEESDSEGIIVPAGQRPPSRATADGGVRSLRLVTLFHHRFMTEITDGTAIMAYYCF